MTGKALSAYITDTYGRTGEQLFGRYPEFSVFRHGESGKWFAVIMEIPEKNLGLPGDRRVTVVNLKCDTRLIAAFREEPGIFPGWHMNKAHWLSVMPEGAEEEKLKFLLEMSYNLTKK